MNPATSFIIRAAPMPYREAARLVRPRPRAILPFLVLSLFRYRSSHIRNAWRGYWTSVRRPPWTEEGPERAILVNAGAVSFVPIMSSHSSLQGFQVAQHPPSRERVRGNSRVISLTPYPRRI
ncbi:hypothetical protein BDW02DRAFT_419976 [Decorospora gaudefroyi]|uniref:Uncharacterized protein n=1 Tax=Decorospora gaudefroyi TaxID=184978 RepID=A0A6A5K4G3_9PLEO|nr:hypothetical protein BDW02DRAFT_419976 [Decorospora gaudefroyi]